MTQPTIDGVGLGKPVMSYGSDGTDWYAVLIDALGHLQVDVVTAALGSGAATEATLLLIKGYVDTLETLLSGGLPAALDSGALKTKEQSPLTGFATSTNQTTMITALQKIDDLQNALGSVNTDDLQVDVKTSALPTGAATAANQAIIAGYIDTLETLLSGGLPAALDTGALKTKEQSPLTGFATSANQTTMITALQLIDDLRAALGSVNTDDLQVDVKTSALPTDAATQTTLALVKTAVEKIDDLQGALGSVATDILRVASKSGDKIFGLESVVAVGEVGTVVGANGYMASDAVPTGKVWVITSILVRETTRATTRLILTLIHDTNNILFYELTEAMGAGVYRSWNGTVYMDAADVIRAYWSGAVDGDAAEIYLIGYQMNAP